jgi:predicted methyltransferase
MRRRLDDRILELCDQAREPQSVPELETIIADLQSALHEHNKRLRKRLVSTLAGREKGFSQERRAS